MTSTKLWRIYIVRCADGSLYTGITTAMERRLRAHNNGKGSKYVASRRPVVLIDSVDGYSQATATRLEQWIKTLQPDDKLLAIDQLKNRLIDVYKPRLVKRPQDHQTG